MSLFYFDEKIEYYEQKLDYSPIIQYLEDLYLSTGDEQKLITLIASAWYYMVEGDVNQKPINYNWKYLQSKLKFYIDLGLKTLIEDERFDFVIGYILDLHWMYLGDEYNGLGLKLMQKCNDVCKNNCIKALVLNFLKKINILDNHTIKALFPTNSELDKYFYSIISKN